MKMTMNTVTLIFLLAISLSSFAIETDDNIKPVYESLDNTILDEGKLIFKTRLFAMMLGKSQSGLPTATAADPKSIGDLLTAAFGLDASTTIYFNHHMAMELGVGVAVMGYKSATLSSISYNYGGTNVVGKNRYMYAIPATITAQYHVAPFGGLSPYLGAGYHGIYFIGTSKDFKIENCHGPVVQAGINFFAKDDTIINLDVRQYFVGTKVTYQPSLVGTTPVSSKLKLNPLVLSLGIGFKF